MREDYFENFVSKFGEATTRLEATTEQVERYRGILPDQLLQVWEDEGFSGYANGRFWLVNPMDYPGVLRTWLGDTGISSTEKYHVVSVSAFGDIKAWGEHQNRVINIVTARHALYANLAKLEDRVSDRISVVGFFLFLEPSEFGWEGANGEDLFEGARATHGDLEPGQIYGFEPALIAGGREHVDNMARVRFDVHASLLRELRPATVYDVSA